MIPAWKMRLQTEEKENLSKYTEQISVRLRFAEEDWAQPVPFRSLGTFRLPAFVPCEGASRCNRCDTCIRGGHQKCQDHSRGLCEPQIRRFEPWPGRAPRAALRGPDVICSTFFGCKKKKNPLVSHFCSWQVQGQLRSCVCVITTVGVIISPNSSVNISWFDFALFVLVCDERAIGKQSSIIHLCSTGSSEFSGMAARRDGWYYRTDCCSTLFCVVVINFFFQGNEKTRDLMRTRCEMSDNAVGSVARGRLREGSRWHKRNWVRLASALRSRFINFWTRNNDLAKKLLERWFSWWTHAPSLKKCITFPC